LVLGAFRLLLRDLLLLDGLRELGAEGQVRDGHIVQLNVEFGEARLQNLADLRGDLLTLGQQLGGRVTSDHRLEDLVADGGEDTIDVVHAEVTVNFG
jgi:hypothetical protein